MEFNLILSYNNLVSWNCLFKPRMEFVGLYVLDMCNLINAFINMYAGFKFFSKCVVFISISQTRASVNEIFPLLGPCSVGDL